MTSLLAAVLNDVPRSTPYSVPRERLVLRANRETLAAVSSALSPPPIKMQELTLEEDCAMAGTPAEYRECFWLGVIHTFGNRENFIGVFMFTVAVILLGFVLIKRWLRRRKV